MGRLIGFVVAVLLFVNCSDASRKYVSVNHSEDFIELRGDGSLIVYRDGVMSEGKYKIEGNVLTIRFPAYGTVFRGTIEGDRIATQGGRVWVRQ